MNRVLSAEVTRRSPVGVLGGYLVAGVRVWERLVLTNLVLPIANPALDHPQLDREAVSLHRHLVAVLGHTEAADPPLQVCQLLLDPRTLRRHRQRLGVVSHRAGGLVAGVGQRGYRGVGRVDQVGHRDGLHPLLDVRVDELGVEAGVVLVDCGGLGELEDGVLVLHDQHVLRHRTCRWQRLADC